MRIFRFLLVTALAAAGLSVAFAQPATAASATVAGFQQCANGTGTAFTCSGGWINGSLQNSNSHFTEDGVVPQRVVVNLPADNLTHTLSFTYQDRKGTVHAYDSLATWNKTVSSADPCQGLAASLCSASPTTLAMSSDGTSIPPASGGNSTTVSTHELTGTDHRWTMYGATLTGDTAPTHDSPASGDDLAKVFVSFTNPTPGVAHQAVLLFGGHLAVGGPASAPRSWGVNLGASSVSGGPYAFKLDTIDGGSTGATANSIQAGAASPLPPAAFTVTKSANPATATPGQTVTYTVTVTNTGGIAGTTTFTDDFDNRLSPSTAVSNPAGNNCVPASGAFTCTTGTIQPTQSQTFTYTAAMPATFSGGAGTGGCATGTYPVANTATVTGGNATTGSNPATATVCVSAAASFSVTKTVDNANPGPGATVTYTITVTNNGSAAGSTSFTDDFDNRLSPSTAVSNPAGNNCVPGSGAFTCTTGTIGANGGTQIFTYTAAMPSTFSGATGGGTCAPGTYQVRNSVTVNGTTVNRDVCVTASPSFTVTKSVDDDTATPGQTITYTITVTNGGTASGSTTFTDDFDNRLSPSTAVSNPAGNDCVPASGAFTCTTGTILAGGSQTFTYTAAMPLTFSGPSGGGSCATGNYPVANSVTLANNASASKTVCVGAAANFTVDKTVDDDTPAPGQTVNYTITVSNTGSASGSTTFTDDYDNRLSPTTAVSNPAGNNCVPASGAFSCTTGTILAGGSQTFSYSATVPSAFSGASGGGGCTIGSFPIANTATLGSGPSDGVVLCVVAAPSYTISKSVDDNSVNPGDVVTYTITVSNNGTASGSTTFTDDFDNRLSPTTAVSSPAGNNCAPGSGAFTCTTGVIPAGGQQTFTYSATVPSSFSGPSGQGTCGAGTFPIANTASLLGGGSDSETVCVTASPSFIVDKSVNDTTPQPGETVTYTVTVTNNGTASGSTTWSDDFDNRLSPSTAVSSPAGNDCVPGSGSFTCATGTILAGGSQTFTYTAQVPSTFSGPDDGGICPPGTYRIANSVSVPGGSSDTIELCVTAGPDFTVTKSVDDATVNPGATVTYTVTVTNEGTAAGSTTWSDDFDNRLSPSAAVSNPAGNNCVPASGAFSCTTGTILAGGSQTFTYTAVMPTTFTGSSGGGDCGPGTFRIKNDVSVTGSSDSQDVCVAASPAFTVTKSVNDATVSPGDTVIYTITVENTGTASGTTTFTDDYDDRLDPSAVTSDPPGAVCGDDGDEISCTSGTILAGGAQTFTYTAQVPSTFTGSDGGGDCGPGTFRIKNDVSVTGSSDSQDVCVTASPDFTASKIASASVATPGQEIVYTVTIENEGTAPGATTFVDDFDNRLDPGSVTITPAGGSCQEIAGTLECSTGTIEAGQSQTFSYTVTLPATFSGDTGGHGCAPRDYAVFNAVFLDGHFENDANATVCVDADAAFSITKDVDDDSAVPGQTVTYTITVTNTGNASGSTSFADDYDNRLDPGTVTSSPSGAVCSDDGDVIECTTGTLAGGASQTFTYTAVLPATFGSNDGTGGCASGTFAVSNSVTLEDGPGDGATVCVTASPRLTVTKSVDDSTGVPGQTVTYTITVTNTGTAAGSTTFTDDYDNRLSPSTAVSNPAGANCVPASGAFSCTTGTIAAGGSQTFTYTATLPASFTGLSGGSGCANGTFPVTNQVTLGNGAGDGEVVCVAASPSVALVKSSSLEVQNNGDQVLTYTLRWTNTGTAEAVNVVVTDQIPANTAFVSCDGCSVSGSPSTASWNVGTIAPLGGTSTATLVVKVTGKQACTISNTAQLRIGSGSPISSNTVVDNVSPQADPAGAHANGSALGVQIKANGLLSLITGVLNVILTNNSTGTVSSTSSSQAGVGFNAGSDNLLSLKLPSNGSTVSADVINVTSASSITAGPPEARAVSTSEIAHICLVKISGLCTVETDTIRAVASTLANGQYATGGSAGSTIQNLKIVGLGTPVDLNQTTLVPLNPGIFGKNSYVAINERTSTVSGAGGKYSADASVTMIHVKITGALGVQAIELIVGQAKAHSDFPKTFQCFGPQAQQVSGHAFNAFLYTGPLVADLLQGYVAITPLGGDERQQVVALTLPANGSVAGAQVADSRSMGSFDATHSTARSYAEIAGDGTKPACVLRTGASCIVTATAIRSEARSEATTANSTSTDTGSQLVGLSVLGVPIAAQPAPNTTIKLPGIGFVVLNEQFCDGGTFTSTHSCTGVPHSGITVRALHVVITVANNILGLNPGVELIVSEAHADSSFS